MLGILTGTITEQDVLTILRCRPGDTTKLFTLRIQALPGITTHSVPSPLPMGGGDRDRALEEWENGQLMLV